MLLSQNTFLSHSLCDGVNDSELFLASLEVRTVFPPVLMCTGPHGSCPPRCKLPAGTPGWASGSWSESGPRSSVCLGRFLRSLKPSDTDYSALCFPQGKETKLRTLKSRGGKKHHSCGSALSSAPRVFFLTETVKAFKTLGV